ncbi:unnamed protein product [Heligmosomoides polygyrus]|uniref:PEST proteolytic signal-containing nuclear protein n=1 Tax=Heligmosomoides polygyrus TaxID=6339 RepID=A0A183G255_HELPZ|nr:unnamed protein product [Heligmosomoides polygyrus]
MPRSAGAESGKSAEIKPKSPKSTIVVKEKPAAAPPRPPPVQPRRKKSAQPREATIEADFEPGLNKNELLEAAEEMANDAGGYENMDPNEAATGKVSAKEKN